ncbi:Bifunctional IPC transferase and DIPP synthase [Streptomyces rimosus subsp. rimosus]|uniref:Bifunctional IPC transferase and DIPP synthase n=1 Tax=Streptomyces rimosus subsp. rimosus TaxID=132474 RepID=A0ABY3YZH2_STRRM|nr:Bifunctional IPC transferase and DIPP synthase [Streptomyces rimosus subsp. rimosus]UTH99573.1 Bifunctional IPC transferase and DIPP synthase [Streptomyces rimosus subsp. rimosus]UTJ17671.1 Bifunctional IPC transferase and DIPP synthase [Streptomyces rimosus subsp. rimosus]UTJ19099.1 Bifunctional IPC transferase and DIPP synthase [Streptomyces rimosus subsp. rimosus]
MADALAEVPADERVAVVDPRFVGHLHSLRLALTDPRFPAAAVPGAVTAQPEARAALKRAATAVPAGPGTRYRVDVLADALAEGMAAEDAAPQSVELGSLVATVPLTPAERAAAEEAVAAVDDEAVRLRTAVKARDGFFTTFFISPYSRYLARWCARRGLTPNQVTTASLLTALIAAGCAATGSRGGFIAAGLLLIFSFVLDCTDGQLARYSLQYSTMGAWLDATFDRAKEYAYYAGLALGAARGGDDVWALALGAMVLQTCRHVVDFSFNEANHDATGNTSPTAALSDRLDSVGWTVWVRRMIVLPIGERWAMIAVLTACTTPRIVFYALLVGCALAACYTTAGRVLRSLTRRARRTDRAAAALADLADSGPLAELFARGGRGGAYTAPVMAFLGTACLLTWVIFQEEPMTWTAVVIAVIYALFSGQAVARPLKGPLDWLVPPLFRAGEYVAILVVAARSGVDQALPAAFGLVAAVAYHHYDTVYRIRVGAGAPPRWLVRAAGGHEGRTLVVVLLAALLHSTGFTIALTALAVVLALLVLAESIRFWVSSGAPAVHDEGEPA